jgi:hypothetical protein
VFDGPLQSYNCGVDGGNIANVCYECCVAVAKVWRTHYSYSDNYSCTKHNTFYQEPGRSLAKISTCIYLPNVLIKISRALESQFPGPFKKLNQKCNI